MTKRGRLAEGHPDLCDLWRDQGRIAFVCSHVDGGICEQRNSGKRDQPGPPLDGRAGARLVDVGKRCASEQHVPPFNHIISWYHATKFAVEGFSDCLRVELTPFGIDVIVIEPGGIRTEWGQIALDTLHQASGHTAYAPQAEEKRAMFLAAAGSASDPDVVAREIIKAIQTSHPKTRYVVGAFAKPSVSMSIFMPNRFNDWMMGVITKSLLKQQRRKAGAQVAWSQERISCDIAPRCESRGEESNDTKTLDRFHCSDSIRSLFNPSLPL